MRNLFYRLRITAALVFLMFLFCRASGQNATVTGSVKNAHGEPVQYANVFLLNAFDSSLVKGMFTDTLGKYSFENTIKGEYCILATFTGLQQAFTKPFSISEANTSITLGVLYMADANAQLKNIIVTAKKPMFEQKADRMAINVKNSITNAGGTALDVLEKSPGVSVNRQNNSIAVNGKSGVSVMINGKLTYMPAEAVVQLLASTSAANIERIELITAPPSKYDAEGNGGYINIVMINNPYSGFSGNYFLGAGYAIRESGSAGINFNYRSAKINIYGNYAAKHNHLLQPSSGLVQFVKGEDVITNRSFSHRDALTQVQNARVGIDYQLDTATIIGALFSGYISHWTMKANNGSTVSSNHIIDTTINTFNIEHNNWQNAMVNLNLQHTFGPGRVLFIDANYLYYRDDNPNIYSNTYYNNAGQFLWHDDLRSTKATPINFHIFSTDYVTPAGKNIIIEAGAKIDFSTFKNTAGVYTLKQGVYVADSSLLANYFLRENISSAYASLTINHGRALTVKAGVRYEYTTTNLGTQGAADIVNKKYGELYPALSVSQKLDGDNSYSFSYTRRITHPAFTDLAPFSIFFDPKTFFTGNPALQPAIANSVQASYSFKNYIFSLAYTNERNSIANYYFQTQRIDTVNSILYLSASNIRHGQYITANFSLPVTVTKWWSMQNNINYSWRYINTIYNNAHLVFKASDYRLNSTQRFTLLKGLLFELSGFYSSASYYGTTKYKPLYQLDAGLQFRLPNKKDVLNITANDIFNSGSNYKFADNLLIPGAVINRSFNFGMVDCKLTYTHSFGNKALKEKRDRSTGAEDELNRVNN